MSFTQYSRSCGKIADSGPTRRLTFKALSVLLSETSLRSGGGQVKHGGSSGAGSGVRKEQVERNRTRRMGIQSSVLVGVRPCGDVRAESGSPCDEPQSVVCPYRENERRCSTGVTARRDGSRTGQPPSLLLRASVRSGADAWPVHDESSTGRSCGSRRSMTTIEPMPQDGHLGPVESCAEGSASV